MNKQEFIELLDKHIKDISDLDSRIIIDYDISRHKGRRSAYCINIVVALAGWKGPSTVLPKVLRVNLRLDIDLNKKDNAVIDHFLAKNIGKLNNNFREYLRLEGYTTEDVSYIQ